MCNRPKILIDNNKHMLYKVFSMDDYKIVFINYSDVIMMTQQ